MISRACGNPDLGTVSYPNHSFTGPVSPKQLISTQSSSFYHYLTHGENMYRESNLQIPERNAAHTTNCTNQARERYHCPED